MDISKCRKIINDYIDTYNLNYTTYVDPGSTIIRINIRSIDVDLRISNNELLLQVWSFGFNYVFKWTRSESEFLQMENCEFMNEENAIHMFMELVVSNNAKYMAMRYSLR